MSSTPLNLVDQRFGRLLVIERVRHKKYKRYNYICKCDCGNFKEIGSSALKKANGTKSCGCLWKESITLEKGQAAFNGVYLEYKLGAANRGYSFNLSKEEFKILTSQNCFYCNTQPKQKSTRAIKNGYYIYNGIDRVNNTIGYELNNCVPCCVNCNLAKRSLSNIDFYKMIDNIYNNLKLKGIL